MGENIPTKEMDIRKIISAFKENDVLVETFGYKKSPKIIKINQYFLIVCRVKNLKEKKSTISNLS